MGETHRRNGSTTTVTVNGAELYHDVRGAGPTVLLVPGSPGDGGQFRRLAEELAGDMSVITYDRRGYSRSPRPAGWDATSVTEHADDAAALIEALGAGPAVVHGHSSAACVAVETALRHPGLVSALVLHEPVIFTPLAAELKTVLAPVEAMVQATMAAGGPPAAVEAFLRAAGGDSVWEALDADTRDRMRGDGEVLFGMEFPTFVAYQPDDAALAGLEMGVRVVVSVDSALPFVAPIARWLASATGTEAVAVPGGHMSHVDHPAEVAAEIRHAAGARV